MKRILAWLMAVVMMVSILPLSVFAEGEIYIKDAFIYECLRGDDGQFHQIALEVDEGGCSSTYTMELNEINETASGIFELCDQQAVEPWEAGGIYPVSYGDGMTFNVEVLENPVVGLEFEDVNAFYDAEQDKYVYEPSGSIYYINDCSESGTDMRGIWINPLNFDGDSPYDYAYYMPINFTDGQEDEAWVEGETYEVVAEVCGVVATFNVTAVIPKTIESVSVEKVEIRAGTGTWCFDYDEDQNEYLWMSYELAPSVITLTYADESTFSGNMDEIFKATGIRPELYTEQSYEQPWGVGTHSAFLVLGDKNCEFEVEILSAGIERIKVEPIEHIEGSGSWMGYWLDGDTYLEDAWMEYGVIPYITVYFEDESFVEGGPYDIEAQSGLKVWYESDQSYENEWGVGTHTATLIIAGQEIEYPIEILEDPVESVVVEKVVRVEGDGTLTDYWGEGDIYIEDAWLEYSITPEQITINFKDDSPSVSGTIDEVAEQLDLVIWTESNQSYENQWDVGEHTAYIYVGGFKQEYTVEIIENPIESIEVEALERNEFDGSMQSYYDEEKDEWLENAWLEYNIDPEQITVHFSDGSPSVSGDPYEIEMQTGYTCIWSSEQSYENQWGVGEHTATLSVAGVEAEYDVIILESDIASIEVEDFSIVEGDGYYNDVWIDEETYLENAWVEYAVVPERITVHYKDGSFFTGEPYEVEEKTGLSITYPAEQSYENQWGVGEHTATLWLGGLRDEYTVTIEENPIKEIEVEDVICYQYAGESRGYWEDDYTYIDNAWIEYEIYPENITVTFQDNTSFIGTPDEFEELYDFWGEANSDQSYENQWGVGTHTATYTLLGKCVEYNVEVKESLVERIEIDDLSIPAFSNGCYDEGIYWYESVEPTATIYYRDGSQEKKVSGILIDDTWYEIMVDLSSQAEEPWEEGGTYEVEGTLLGASDTFNITIISAPVQSFTVKDAVVYEGLDSYHDGWQEIYYTYPMLDEVVLKDAQAEFYVMGSELQYQGQYYSADCNAEDLQADEPWEVGESYEITATLMGLTTTYTVTVLENPIKEVEFLKAPDKVQYMVSEEANLKGAVIRIHYADDSYEDVVFDQDYCAGCHDVFHSEKLDREFNLWVHADTEEPGSSYLVVDFNDFYCEMPITVVENPIEKITIREKEDKTIIITAFDDQKALFEMKVLDFCDCCVDGEIDYSAYMITDRGTFFVSIYKEDSGVSIQMRNGDKKLRSNTLPSCAMFETVLKLKDYNWYLATPYVWNHDGDSIYFEGEITANNIDSIIEIAGMQDGLWEKLWEDGEYDYSTSFYPALLVDEEEIEAAVYRQFGLEIDLSLSANYDADRGIYIHNDPPFIGYSQSAPTKMGYDNGIWAVEISAYDNILRMNISEEGELLSLTVNSEYLPGDVSGDGKVSIADAVLALRALSDNLDQALINEKAADVVKDSAGGMTTADVVKILRYILEETPVLA